MLRNVAFLRKGCSDGNSNSHFGPSFARICHLNGSMVIQGRKIGQAEIDLIHFIGWGEEARRRNLPYVANHTRFLILPWVRVENLASHLLGRIARRVGRDWLEKYGHGLHALETFVDRSRFTGGCYRAANWRCVGQTTGRTRNDVANCGPLSSIKHARQFFTFVTHPRHRADQ